MSQVGSATRTPVAVFAFNRPDTLRKTLCALEQCKDFLNRPVVIFCDGPRPEVVSDRNAVAEVVNYSRDWAHRLGAVVQVSDENRGLRRSILAGISMLLSDYKSVIVLEDDIVVSRIFLQFMDRALSTFEDVDTVWQVSGWFPPSRAKLAPGFLRVPGCWGWGTWRRAWSGYCDDAELLASQIGIDELFRFNLDGVYDYGSALSRNALGLQNTWHVRWYASMFLSQALAFYPGVSLTRNIGFDKRGTNCGADRTSRILMKQTLLQHMPAIPDKSYEIRETQPLFSEMRDFLKWQAAEWSRPSLGARLGHRIRRLLGW